MEHCLCPSEARDISFVFLALDMGVTRFAVFRPKVPCRMKQLVQAFFSPHPENSRVKKLKTFPKPQAFSIKLKQIFSKLKVADKFSLERRHSGAKNTLSLQYTLTSLIEDALGIADAVRNFMKINCRCTRNKRHSVPKV